MLPHFIPSDLLIGQYSFAGEHPEIPAYRLNGDSHFVGAFNIPSKSEEIATVAVIANGVVTYNPLLKKPAAQIATASVIEAFGKNSSNNIILAILKDGFALASKRVGFLETSTVCAAIVIKEQRLHIVNVGDCRIFLIRDSVARQISVTHTFEERLIEDKHVTAEQLEISRSAGSSLYQFLGFQDMDKPDFHLRLHDNEADDQALKNQGLRLKTNDKVVLCSNGVFGYWINRHRWQLFEEHLLKPTENPQETVEQFVHAVREQGAFHALTVVAVQVP
ncbi:MAG: hypothetical protein HY862_20140 [Chloroflexi bacterium]|nr:hypothetical protein [Chloroflexota bacterium]